MILNHTDSLKLSSQHISSNWILELYNINSPSVIKGFNTGGKLITQADDMLFIGDTLVSNVDSSLVGAATFNTFIVAALNKQLQLIDEDGHLVATLTADDSIPTPITKIGTDNESAVIIASGKRLFRLTENLEATEIAHSETSWSEPAELSLTQTNEIIDHYRSEIISLETFLLDIHSGRFFGQYGTLFFDLVGIVFLFLAFSGIYIWLKQRKKHR